MTARRRDTTADAVTPVARAAVRARGPRAALTDSEATGDEPAVPDASRVDPDVLTTLLTRHGWVRRGGAGGRYSRWAPPEDQEPDTSLLVPADRGFDDSVDLIEESLGTLARSGVPSARAILAALLVPGDEIHWRREVPGVGGAVSWASETELRDAATAMLAAAAKAGRARCAYFGARLDRHAARFLDRVLVVAPGTGAGLLTAYTPAPTDRPAATTLVLALEALREAVDLQRATGRTDAFDNGVRLGLSRELICSVVLLVRGSEGARVSLHWSAQVGPPPGFGSRRPAIEFSPGDLPALTDAAARLERSEPPVEVELTGAVVRLKRAAPGSAGTVRLRVLSGADVDEVRVKLPDAEYRVAVAAHLDGTPVRLRGRLERKGGFRRVAGARDLTPVELDDAERERLAKTLRLRAGLAGGGADPEDETD